MLLKVGGSILLLWLSPASASYGAERPRADGAGVCETRSQSPSLKRFVRGVKSVGGPLTRRGRKVRLGLTTRRSHFQHPLHRAGHGDDDVIANDAPAAQSDVDPLVVPQRLVALVVEFEQRPFTLAYFPRSPRGPPAPV